MPCRIEVLFTPADFRALRDRDLSRSTCVVFDVLRATTTFVTALANGAEAVIPVEEISEALAIRRQRPEILLAGERNGLRITAAMTGGVEFDLGNSPREFTPERVRGRTIVSTTTNGTRAVRACAGAGRVFIGSFLNLTAVARAVFGSSPETLLLVCAGTGEGVALEDVLAAGALCESLRGQMTTPELLDSALIARDIYVHAQDELPAAICQAQNARRLLDLPELRQDVEFCIRRDALDLVAAIGRNGAVIRVE
jgi:2-phosphosulfolactate phosphatase